MRPATYFEGLVGLSLFIAVFLNEWFLRNVDRFRGRPKQRATAGCTRSSEVALVSAEAASIASLGSDARAAALAGVGITKTFGPVTALDNVSFSAQYGRVLALLGDNGAGKTTLIKVAVRRAAARLGRPPDGRRPDAIQFARPGAQERHRYRVPGPRGVRPAVDHAQHRARQRAADPTGADSACTTLARPTALHGRRSADSAHGSIAT